MIVREMTDEECEALLAETRLARLACVKDGEPYVVPVSVAYSPPHLYGFSMPGQKIDWMRANPRVCVLFEHFDGGRAWRSVVLHGIYEELPDRIGSKHERDRAWSVLKEHANWWEPGGLKPVPGPVSTVSTHLFYRIIIERMTGRQAVEGVD